MGETFVDVWFYTTMTICGIAAVGLPLALYVDRRAERRKAETATASAGQPKKTSASA